MIFKVSLINVNFTGVGEFETKTTQSFLIHRHSNIDYILIKFSNLIVDLLFQYQIPDTVNVNIFMKEWIDSSELKNIASLYSILDRREDKIIYDYNLKKLDKDKDKIRLS